MQKRLYLFAGVNGAGKSTLYNITDKNVNLKDILRINTDEIVRTFGDWKNSTDQIKAAKIAIKLRNQCFEEGKSFQEETTLTGKTILKLIDRAKDLVYEVYLYYVGVETPDIAKTRVKNRVSRGGHDILLETIEKRYYESLENLLKIIKKCDVVELYDNTKKYEQFFLFQDSKIIEKADFIPEWAEKAVQEKMKELNQKEISVEQNPWAEKLKNDKRGLKR